MNTARFIGLDASPLGFVPDEASNATHIICLVETGADANGVRIPLFSDQFEERVQRSGTGLVPPTHLYFGALWEVLFGHSVASIRAISAFLLALMTLGVYLVVRLFCPPPAALLGALAASVSPWAFQLGRLSGMVGFQPVLLVFWIYFFLRSHRLRDAILAGLFLSLTLYSYPPARVQVPLLLLPLIWLKKQHRGIEWAFMLAYLVAAFLVSLPLAQHLNDPENQLRTNQLAIFNKDYLHQFSDDSPLRIMRVFLHNLRLHFNPDNLFFTGDHNQRHSTQAVGELSWLDSGALLAASALLVAGLAGWRLSSGQATDEPRGLNPLLLFCGLGYLAGVVPAALTWEGLPHALRSAGAVPFLALLTGLTVWKIGQVWRPAVIVTAGVSAIFVGYFLWNYFWTYPDASGGWWYANVRQAAEEARRTGNWTRFATASKDFPEVAARYFLIEYDGQDCLSSAKRLRELRRHLR